MVTIKPIQLLSFLLYIYSWFQVTAPYHCGFKSSQELWNPLSEKGIEVSFRSIGGLLRCTLWPEIVVIGATKVFLHQ